jgi:hypothetical protein
MQTIASESQRRRSLVEVSIKGKSLRRIEVKVEKRVEIR